MGIKVISSTNYSNDAEVIVGWWLAVICVFRVASCVSRIQRYDVVPCTVAFWVRTYLRIEKEARSARFVRRQPHRTSWPSGVTTYLLCIFYRHFASIEARICSQLRP